MANTSQKINILKINALSELERIGYKYEPRGDSEVSLICPVHDDSSPSVSLNVKKNKWICHTSSCDGKGDIISLLAYILKTHRQVVIEDLHTRYDLVSIRTIRSETIERHHAKIWGAGPLLEALRERGVSDNKIREARLGYFDGRIMIPVFDESDRAINIRKYLPGAPGNEKMKNTSGYTTMALYQPKHLKYDTIWICGGEIKALVAGEMLEKVGIGAVAPTAGEGAWDSSFTPKFKGKKVYICNDIDAGGIAGSRRQASQVALTAKSVYIITIPLDINKYPKGDINDWIGKEGATINDLIKAMTDAKEFTLTAQTEQNKFDLSKEHEIRLVEALNADYIGKRIKCDTVITAMDTTPYLVPCSVNVDCIVDSGKSENCTFCRVRLINPEEETNYRQINIESTNPGILDMVNAPASMQEEAMKRAISIPAGCKVSTVTPHKFYTVIDARLTPQLQISGDNRDHIVQEAFLVVGKEEIELNTPYVMSGRMFPHPKTQQAVLLIDKIDQGADNLVSFRPSPEELKSLEMLRPDDWTVGKLESKLDERYKDVSNNVTRIYKRDKLHLVFDLTYHSVLYFEFDGRRQNGWVNALIVGDSSQGKSETAIRLMEHYGLGVKHDCKNASSAGLVGGLQQLGSNRWFVSWGVVPMHDRRLVIMEELKGAAVEVVAKMTDMRSSGIAEISKIEKRRAHARTRLIMISNPRSGRPLAAYNFGVEAIKELIGSQEDIRRFDIAAIPAASQINPDDLNRLSSSRESVDHTYTYDICKRTILFAWTRALDQIRFDKGVEKLCLDKATELCSKFSESMPLCDKGTMRYKLARLSISVAAMTFSTLDDNEEVILVRSCHIEYIAKMLTEEYSLPEFGYADYSKAQVFSNSILDPKIVKAKLLSSKYPKDLITQLIHTDEITLIDIQDWCEIERDIASALLSILVRKHALYRVKRYYAKTSEFIKLLKEIRDSGDIDKFSLQKENEF